MTALLASLAALSVGLQLLLAEPAALPSALLVTEVPSSSAVL